MSAATLLGVARARGLFQRLILQSGAARNVHSPAAGERVAEVFCEEAGVRRGEAAALRTLPVQALLGAQERAGARLRTELDDPAFEPVVDGVLLPRPPLESVALGEARDVSLLVGTNRDEWRFYGLGDAKARLLDEAGILRRFRRGLPGRDENGCELAERVIETYREARRGKAGISPTELWFAIQTDRWFRHPAMQLAECHVAHQPDTRAYLLTWESPAFGGGLGSCHALDVPFVFGGVGDARMRPLLGEGEAVERLSERIQTAWCAFAHGEPPSHPELPEWPTYDGRRRATLLLGEQCGVVDAPDESERSFWDAL